MKIKYCGQVLTQRTYEQVVQPCNCVWCDWIRARYKGTEWCIEPAPGHTTMEVVDANHASR